MKTSKVFDNLPLPQNPTSRPAFSSAEVKDLLQTATGATEVRNVQC